MFVLPISKNPVGRNFHPEDYTNDFYGLFRDEFDFLMVIANIELRETGHRLYAGSHHSVSNDVKGIGLDSFRNDARDSAARLQGVLEFPWKDATDRSPVLHELMLRWGNFVVEPHPHWWFSSVDGQLGGFDIDALRWSILE